MKSRNQGELVSSDSIMKVIIICDDFAFAGSKAMNGTKKTEAEHPGRRRE